MAAHFYVLETDSEFQGEAGTYSLLAKLAARAAEAAPVLIQVPEALIETIDDALWSHPKAAFIPHGVESGERICIATNAPENFSGVCINLTSTAQTQLVHADRIIEIVRGSEASKTRGREHFKAYKQAGFKLTHHKV